MLPVINRRWFRYSLRMLFVTVTIVGVWLGWNLHQVRQRGVVLGRDNVTPIYVGSPSVAAYPRRTQPGRIPITWTLLGARPVHKLICAGGYESAGDVQHVAALFPEAELTVVSR